MVMLPQRGGGLPVLGGGGGGSLMTHNAGFVTTQSKAFKYVMASEPCRYPCYDSDKLLFKNTHSIGNKMFLNST
jgi:hypothetical protein